MNKKTIVNRTLPLIIALFVVIVVAVCVTVFSGSKRTPMVDNKNEAYQLLRMGEKGVTELLKETITSMAKCKFGLAATHE